MKIAIGFNLHYPLNKRVQLSQQSLLKLKKQLDKLNSKGTKTEKPESEEKEEIVDEAFPESGAQLEENEGSDLNSMSDYDLMSYAEDEGMEDMIVRDGEGGLANREEIIAALSEGSNLPSAPSHEETDANQVYEMLIMQKRAGIISETEYNAKVKEVEKSFKK